MILEIPAPAHKIWDAIGPDFFNGPASISGNNHQPGTTMADHLLQTHAVGVSLWRTLPDDLRHDDDLRQSFEIACACHDVGKCLDLANHEFAGAALIAPLDPTAALIAARHSGRWGPSWNDFRAWAVSNCLLNGRNLEVIRSLGTLCHLADYVASRKEFRVVD